MLLVQGSLQRTPGLVYRATYELLIGLCCIHNFSTVELQGSQALPGWEACGIEAYRLVQLLGGQLVFASVHRCTPAYSACRDMVSRALDNRGAAEHLWPEVVNSSLSAFVRPAKVPEASKIPKR